MNVQTFFCTFLKELTLMSGNIVKKMILKLSLYKRNLEMIYEI